MFYTALSPIVVAFKYDLPLWNVVLVQHIFSIVTHWLTVRVTPWRDDLGGSEDEIEVPSRYQVGCRPIPGRVASATELAEFVMHPSPSDPSPKDDKAGWYTPLLPSSGYAFWFV
jgi:hypothetical protein